MEEVTNSVLLEKINNIQETIKIYELKQDKLEDRIRHIEDWKLVFVAKYSVYSAIALFLGSLLATLSFDLIKSWIIK